MEPAALFGPTTWLHLAISPGRKEAVKKASPNFPKWAGEIPGSSYGGKPFTDYNGRVAFAELSILWTVSDAGWEGVWVTHAGGREKHRQGFWGPQSELSVPSSVLRLLSDVREARSDSSKGTWDIVCWPKGAPEPHITDMRFIESKWGGKDAIKSAQIEWYYAVRDAGVPRESFLVVEWNLSQPLRASI